MNCSLLLDLSLNVTIYESHWENLSSQKRLSFRERRPFFLITQSSTRNLPDLRLTSSIAWAWVAQRKGHAVTWNLHHCGILFFQIAMATSMSEARKHTRDLASHLKSFQNPSYQSSTFLKLEIYVHCQPQLKNSQIFVAQIWIVISYFRPPSGWKKYIEKLNFRQSMISLKAPLPKSENSDQKLGAETMADKLEADFVKGKERRSLSVHHQKADPNSSEIHFAFKRR